MKKQIILAMSLMFAVTISKAQSVPNGTFQNWSNPNGYLVSNDWETLNDMTSTTGIFTATRGGTVSDYYLKLTTKNVTGMGIKPGVAVSGMLDMNSVTPLSGFPYTSRPTIFKGKWQFMGNSANDIGVIAVYLTKWNTGMGMRDTVGFAIQNLDGMVMSWANFNFPITYNSSTNPDSCIIYLNASGTNPEAGSYLYVDNLDFAGVIASVENTETTGTFSIFPNPTTEFVQIDLSGLKSIAQQFELLDITGKIVTTQTSNGSSFQNISLNQLPRGNYLFRIHTAKGIVTQKISKQ